MPRAFAAAAVSALMLAAPSAAGAATLRTNGDCYISGQRMSVGGTGWAPASAWSVFGGGITGSGTADSAGNFAFNTNAPTIAGGTTKPRKIQLVGNQDGSQVATTSFQVVNFLVRPRSVNGKPTSTTSWGFSGFIPGKAIFIHVKRGSKTYTQKAGKASRPCGTLRTRLRRLPAVPQKLIKYGKYKVFVDNRRKFKAGGLQYRATITIFKTFK
jgi:hypothetical protein